MKDIIFFLVMVLFIDGFLFLGQTAVNEINPTGAPTLYHYDAGLLQANDEGNYTLTTDVLGQLPGGESSVSAETGNIFTDIFSSIKGWLGEATGINYVIDIVNALPNFLKALGLPAAFVFMIGSLWHTMTVFLIILLLWGRD